MVGQPGSWELRPKMLLGVRQLATRRRCPLDRVHTNLYLTSELYLPGCTYRRVLRETARRLGKRSSLSPPGRSKQSTIVQWSPVHLSRHCFGVHKWPPLSSYQSSSSNALLLGNISTSSPSSQGSGSLLILTSSLSLPQRLHTGPNRAGIQS